MREERLEVSVTFDERYGYIGSELRSPVVAFASRRPAPPDRDADGARHVASSCSSTVSPSGSGTGGGRRRS